MFGAPTIHLAKSINKLEWGLRITRTRSHVYVEFIRSLKRLDVPRVEYETCSESARILYYARAFKETVMKERRELRLIAVVAAGFLIQLPVASAAQMQTQGNDKPKNINRIIHLEPPESADKGATGIAKISAKVKGKKPSQTFQVIGANLKIGSTYDLFVDAVKIASKSAAIDPDDAEDPGDEGAAVEFFFSSKAKGPSDSDDEDGQRPLPDSLTPVTKIKKVELKDSTGKVVLVGEFPTLL